MNRWVRIGASVQLPYYVHGSGTVKTRLPSDPQFDGAVVVGDRIDVAPTFETVLQCRQPRKDTPLTLPRAYIYCARKAGPDPFAQFKRLSADPGWRYVEMDASHSPNVTAPEPLAAPSRA